ncbi:hypothetical protein TNCV_4838611 [Trichonephila clavipes]|nr:hypothetical protein TNCV_4838611 [Trichonephila clavipes]
MVTPCFVTSDNLQQKAVFLLMASLQMTQRQRHSNIALLACMFSSRQWTIACVITFSLPLNHTVAMKRQTLRTRLYRYR